MTGRHVRVAAVPQLPSQGARGPVVAVRGLVRTYGSGSGEVHALRGVSLDVEPGELVAVVGRSGSGKTTLLNVIGGLDRPTGGSVRVCGQEVAELDERGLAALRRDVLAFVFQTFGLLPMLSAVENVGIPLRLLRVPARQREARAREVLERVGLGAAADQRPPEMSGGQQQRLLLADEPTGQLDTTTGAEVLDLLRELVHTEGMTCMVSTHDPALTAAADRVVRLQDGVLVPS
ncbi:putative ABC transport system ATP-binding protein [Motilibacter rhizosphaerae]|uniref:Putative ABC transport system ATP-binding protein n=1 Tax=Motilibacter rhizosphaerae TaxID=598652 RepID=A0A4V2F4Z8_9ACTN|nr:putative ABC transport system ATP-binding protein [Motilibacter rhizosphaerae]